NLILMGSHEEAIAAIGAFTRSAAKEYTPVKDAVRDTLVFDSDAVANRNRVAYHAEMLYNHFINGPETDRHVPRWFSTIGYLTEIGKVTSAGVLSRLIDNAGDDMQRKIFLATFSNNSLETARDIQRSNV